MQAANTRTNLATKNALYSEASYKQHRHPQQRMAMSVTCY